MELKELIKKLEKVEDPRRTDRGHILHKLVDILIIALCCLICNGTDFEDMEDFGKEREEWLKTFLELPNGIPSSDTFRRIFEQIDPNALSECLYDWLANNRKEGSVIAIDGKTIRGSANHKHRAYHVVSAFVAENQITLGEITTDEKSNEITAVPELLRTINVENSIVTADAMSCQKEIVSNRQLYRHLPPPSLPWYTIPKSTPPAIRPGAQVLVNMLHPSLHRTVAE